MQVSPEVDEGLRKQLEDMGFSANKAIRALHFTGTGSLEQAVSWLVEHGEDADIDQPLLVLKARGGSVSVRAHWQLSDAPCEPESNVRLAFMRRIA